MRPLWSLPSPGSHGGLVRPTLPPLPPLLGLPWEKKQLLPQHVFSRLDRAQSTLMDVFNFLARHEERQHEAAELAEIAERLVSFTRALARGKEG